MCEDDQVARTPASHIIKNRMDMTEWVIHFVHDLNHNDEPADDALPYDSYDGYYPYQEDRAKNYRFSDWSYMDDYIGWGPEACAFSVLHKIITDGHIRATWAFRNGRPTIYGPRAAVCFTEMPLYALVDYARHRPDNSVDCYGIGLLKAELFAAGGRPVIYGLSRPHRERTIPQCKWPRKLANSCGIAESEQYRYVAMSSDRERPIDWTHEREWRWADHDDAFSCPGVPIWLKDEPHLFTQVILVVPQAEEAEHILDLLKELNDAGANTFDIEFSRSTLEATSVISLEQLRDGLADDAIKSLRLEDIPQSRIRRFESPEVSQDYLDRVTRVLAQAREAADRAIAEKWEESSKGPDGTIPDVSGFAELCVYDARSSLVSALVRLGEVLATGEGRYIILGIGSRSRRRDQALCLGEAAVEAALAVFRENFPDITFLARTRWD